MKKTITFLICLFVLLPLEIKAADKEIVTYDIEANVNIDRTVDIKENYNFYFIEKVNSIDRVLDTKLTVIRKDKTTRKTNIIISNEKVENSKYTITNKDSKEIINFTVDGAKDSVDEYNLSYTLNLGKDTGVGYDELFLNLIDGNLNANTSNINFKVNLPVDFDGTKVDFLLNGKYNLTEDDITYSVKNNTIYGVLERSLTEGQTFSIRVELPDGYFTGASDNYNYLLFLTLIAPIIGLMYAIVCWLKYAKGNKIKGKITNNPPNDFDPAEIAFLYRGYSKESDIVTLLIYLANKNYLMFEESDDGYKLERPNSFKIIKLKDYDGENAAQKILFDKLFKTSDVVELEDIEYNLFDSLMSAKGTLDNQDNRYKLFYKNISNTKLILNILIIISTICMNGYSIYLFASNYFLIPIISAVLIFGIYILFAQNTKILIKIIFGVGLIAISMYIGIIPIINEHITLIIYIVGMILIFIIALLSKMLPERTIYGNDMLGDVYGFKSGLLSISKDELTDKINENANYFYDMYPYVYLFDICEEWNKKGTEINSFPNWYVTKESYSLENFQKFVRNMVYLTTQAMFKRQLPGMSDAHIEYKKDIKIKNMEQK